MELEYRKSTPLKRRRVPTSHGRWHLVDPEDSGRRQLPHGGLQHEHGDPDHGQHDHVRDEERAWADAVLIITITTR